MCDLLQAKSPSTSHTCTVWYNLRHVALVITIAMYNKQVTLKEIHVCSVSMFLFLASNNHNVNANQKLILYYSHCNRVHVYCTGHLIFRAVAEPWISSKSAKSREMHKNTRNPAKFTRNLTKYMSAQYIWKLSWLLARTWCKLANLPWNFVTAVKQHPRTTRRSLDLRKTGKQQCKNPGVPSVDRGNWGWEFRMLALHEECCV